MKINPTFYIFSSLMLVLSCALITILLVRKPSSRQKEQGYMVTFPSQKFSGVWTEEFKRSRSFTTYVLTDDSIKNNITIQLAHQALTDIRLHNDSIHGVNIEFSDNTPYIYYLRAIAFCVKNTRLFLPIENHIYAACRSKHQATQDSLHVLNYNKEHQLSFE